MAKRLPQQVIKVKNYGEEEVNMLAVIDNILEKMTGEQRHRAFGFFKQKYSKDWRSDSYQLENRNGESWPSRMTN